jgi:dihydroorotate dehydrogenase electron transfer subunit
MPNLWKQLMLQQILATVTANSPLTGDYWLIEVEAPSIAQNLQPGQFVNIRVAGSLAPYLRRPFSVYRLSRDRRRLQVAYKALGEGTRLMTTTMPVGGSCDLIGPLGKGFSLPTAAERIAVVGRGIGIAALPTLVDHAVSNGVEVYGFLSARDPANLVATDIFAELGCPVFTHTDLEAPGAKVSDQLAPLLSEVAFDAFYVCGSNRLIRAVNRMATTLGIRAQAAMEQLMACGFGDCHGCVIQVNLDREGRNKGYREVCHHGPVFNAWEVVDAYA